MKKIEKIFRANGLTIKLKIEEENYPIKAVYYSAEEVKRREKQEEWVDGLAEVMEDVYVFEDVVDFISQLLSERTFSKQELTLMQKAVEDGEDWAEEWMVGDVQMRALEKIDKLLKEEE